MNKEQLKQRTTDLAVEIDQIIDYVKGKQYPALLRARLRGLRRSVIGLGMHVEPVRENAVQRVLARLRGYLR